LRFSVPKTLIKHISGEFTKAFTMTLVVVTAMWVLVSAIAVVRREVLGPKAFLLALPVMAVISFKYTLPMAVLLGASISYGRMSAENEIRAMEWNGIHIGWAIFPAAGIAVAASIVALVLNCEVIPAAHRGLDTIVRANIMDIIDRQLVRASRGREQIVFDTLTVDVKAYDRSTRSIEGIAVYQTDAQERPLRRIDAASARVVPGRLPGAVLIATEEPKEEREPKYVTFEFDNGVVTEFDPESGAIQKRFHAPAVALDLSDEEAREIGSKGMSMRQLGVYARSARRPAQRYVARTDIFERYALGVSPLFFVLLAAPMASLVRWKHVLTSFLPSLGVVIVIYYPLIAWAKVWGVENRMDPAYGMFAGDAAVLVAAAGVIIVLVRR